MIHILFITAYYPPEKGAAQVRISETAQRLVKESRESKNITIRMPLRDIERARLLADRKGIGYQTLIKVLVHEGLAREARRD